jgi:hypothetical protein
LHRVVEKVVYKSCCCWRQAFLAPLSGTLWSLASYLNLLGLRLHIYLQNENKYYQPLEGIGLSTLPYPSMCSINISFYYNVCSTLFMILNLNLSPRRTVWRNPWGCFHKGPGEMLRWVQRCWNLHLKPRVR